MSLEENSALFVEMAQFFSTAAKASMLHRHCKLFTPKPQRRVYSVRFRAWTCKSDFQKLRRKEETIGVFPQDLTRFMEEHGEIEFHNSSSFFDKIRDKVDPDDTYSNYDLEHESCLLFLLKISDSSHISRVVILSHKVSKTKIPREQISATVEAMKKFGGSTPETRLSYVKTVMFGKRICNYCPREGKARCGGCILTFYCSKECQRKDRPAHRRVCAERKNDHSILMFMASGIDVVDVES